MQLMEASQENRKLFEIAKLYSRISGISYLAIQREVEQWHYAPSMYSVRKHVEIRKLVRSYIRLTHSL